METETTHVGLDGSREGKMSNPSKLKQDFLAHLEQHETSNHIYTDGSKMAEGVGFAVVLPGTTRRGRLPEASSIYSAELYAILTALKQIHGEAETNYTIFSDSMSALEGIKQLFPKHPILKKIQDQLARVQRQNKNVQFCKVPSQVGIEGNEAADRAEKRQ